MLKMIDDGLAGEVKFLEFAKSYYMFVIDEFPSDALIERAELFDYAQETLDSVDWNAASLDQEPSPEGRKVGFMSQRQYLAWLRQRREDYRHRFGR